MIPVTFLETRETVDSGDILEILRPCQGPQGLSFSVNLKALGPFRARKDGAGPGGKEAAREEEGGVPYIPYGVPRATINIYTRSPARTP